jgi:hypothetical protein
MFFLLGCSNKECQKEVLVFVDECDNLTSIDLNFNQVNIYKETKESTGCRGSGKLVYQYCIETDTLTIRANINGKDTTLHYNKKEIPEKILFGYINDIQIFTEKDEGRWMLD